MKRLSSQMIAFAKRTPELGASTVRCIKLRLTSRGNLITVNRRFRSFAGLSPRWARSGLRVIVSWT